ncbi:LOW QUALITY PROTEIN: hypothetical protein ACHAWO_010695 [Cyclotella atomus]|uniref:Uncharacterized protein n=1 Tax=Cyclotella atomus TaxID=382360 RepID=A0ABD3QNJ9_9STRA
MPRRHVGKFPPVANHFDCNWENLDDESTCCLESTDKTTSLTDDDSTCYSYSHPGSEASLAILARIILVGLIASVSDASQATVCCSAKHTTDSVLEPLLTATKQTLDQITQATIGLKAVKADDADVLVYLWNRRIIGDNPTSARERALNGFRKLGFRWFLRGLCLDCARRLVAKFGRAWEFMALRTPEGRLTRIGKEKEAMRHMIWHAIHTNWFEYKAGSHLYHFRFPISGGEAQDGVPIYFEKPGPSVMQRQPEFPNPAMRQQVKEKIEKVIRRRYLTKVSTGLKLKSLIKYFAVPKGLDDVRIVYDGTASGLNDSV